MSIKRLRELANYVLEPNRLQRVLTAVIEPQAPQGEIRIKVFLWVQLCNFEQLHFLTSDIVVATRFPTVSGRLTMPKKLVTKVAAMWINPRSNLNHGHIAWDRRSTDAGSSRYLELADVALRPKNAEFKKANSDPDQ
jgi:hypothetical protein